MRGTRFGPPAAIALAVLAVGAWAAARGGEGGEGGEMATPVDILLTEAAELVDGAPTVASGTAVVGGTDGAKQGAGAEAGVVRFASDAPESSDAPVTGRSRAAWDLPEADNDRVEHWIEFLKGRNHGRTHLWLEREGKYGGFIRGKLRERGMPEDLLYLVMIESGLSPEAYSRAHAAGLWQFIAATGRRYGLEVSTYVDERRDPLAATDAALEYLSDLHDRFGSWYLAAAAYNSGENRVERVLRKHAGGRKGDESLFWRIDDYLPRETRDYVPLMLAAAHIGKDPNRYGFVGLEHQAPLAFDEVAVPGGVSLSSVAEVADVAPAAVSALNPHLVRGVTPPGRSWRVRVPVGSGERVAAGLERLEKEERLATVVHRVRRGETLSHIARRYGVSVDALRSANGRIDPRRVQVGQRIRVPMGSGARVASSSDSRRADARWTTYRVRNGDTLWDIARRYDVTVRQIKSWNGIGSRIYPGQRIRIAA